MAWSSLQKQNSWSWEGIQPQIAAYKYSAIKNNISFRGSKAPNGYNEVYNEVWLINLWQLTKTIQTLIQSWLVNKVRNIKQ